MNDKIRLLALPLLSQLWLLSETLLWSEAGNVLFWRKDEEGENMSPILCFLASPPFTLFSTSSFSNEFLLLTGWLGTKGRVLLLLLLDDPKAGLFLPIDFFKRKLCFGLVQPSGCVSSIAILF